MDAHHNHAEDAYNIIVKQYLQRPKKRQKTVKENV